MKYILISLLLWTSSLFAQQPSEIFQRQFSHLETTYEVEILVKDACLMQVNWIVKQMDPTTRTLAVVEESVGYPKQEIDVYKSPNGVVWFNEEYFLGLNETFIQHLDDPSLDFFEVELDWVFLVEESDVTQVDR